MICTQLPMALEIAGKYYPLNKQGSFDVVLDCIELMDDEEIPEGMRTRLFVEILFGFDVPPVCEESMLKIEWFLTGGNAEPISVTTERNKETFVEVERKKTVDMVKDFSLYISSLNQVAGYDVRNPERFTHWWTFLSFFRELHDCYYTEIVDIRKKLNTVGFGKLTKEEKEFLSQNKKEIGFEMFSKAETEFFARLGV